MATDTTSAAPSEREKFEAWLHDNFGKRSTVRAPDGYAHSVAHAALPSTYASVQMLWEAWQAACRAQPTPPAADQEPFGYFRAEPFGWTDCAETDEGAVALYDRPAPPAVVEPDELSPDFTDTARAALLWVLWHHQGGSSPMGQPIRFALGMGQHDRLNDHQLREAKRWERLHPVNPAVFSRGPAPLTDEQISALADIAFKEHFEDKNDDFHVALGRAIEAAHGIGIKKGDGHA